MGLRARQAIAAVSASLLLASGAAGVLVYRHLDASLPASDRVVAGVSVDGVAVSADAAAEPQIESVADRVLDRSVVVKDGDTEIGTVTLRSLGATADTDAAIASALAVGRTGTWEERVYAARRSRDRGTAIALSIDLPVEAVAELLAPSKEETDKRPRGARRVLAGGGVIPHESGSYADAYATAEAILRAARAGAPSAEVAHYAWIPAATTEVAVAADVSNVVGSFETRYGGPPGRDKNILRATDALHGIVLAPGDTVSFNEVVGPRTEDNGFFPAPEIYKGESRLGIGGGSCQVASTLYAAAFFGGLDVVERRNHSRPSGYIRPGLDATVSYPVLDLRIRNNFSFPVVLAATLEPGKLRFELLGKERPAAVELATQTAGILKYSRKLEKAALPEGEFRLKQKGKRGMVIKRIKTVTLASTGQTLVEESTDTYPAQQEIYLVGPKTDAETLPPLEGPDAAVKPPEGA
jgi:vancomycin resistance protein YoaR